jgi:hypothetical protein
VVSGRLPARLLFDPAESDLERDVRELALRTGWPLAYHTHISRGSAPGFPDWIFLRPGRIVALELKAQGGAPSAEQVAWIGMLSTVPGVDAAIIYRKDLQDAADLLTGRRR